jgi:hypothetical protein
MKNLNTVLPFYDAYTEWYKYRDDVVIGDKQLRLVCGLKRLIPFIIRRATTGGTTSTLTFQLVDENHGSPFATPVAATYLNYDTGTVYDYIWYDASLDFVADIPIGKIFYVKITDTSQSPTKVYYSERIMAVANITDYTMLEFWDDELLNNIKASFHQKVYIDNVYKTPDYIREDEGEKMDGILLKQKMTVQKVLNLHNLLVPEFLLDALITLPMMTNVQVTDINSTCIVPLEVRLKDPDWQADTGGSFAKLDIQFVEWVVLKKGGYKEVGCNCSSGTTTAIIKEGSVSLVAGVPSVVTFSTAFADTGYSLEIRAFEADGSPAFPTVTAKLAASFTMTALVNCTVEWIAIRV